MFSAQTCNEVNDLRRMLRSPRTPNWKTPHVARHVASLTSCLSVRVLQAPRSGPASPQSAWRGLGRKLRLLVPYVWPSGTPALQVLVLLCAGLLLAERLVNVLVPVYSKNIGELLRTAAVPPPNCRWQCAQGFTTTPPPPGSQTTESPEKRPPRRFE